MCRKRLSIKLFIGLAILSAGLLGCRSRENGDALATPASVEEQPAEVHRGEQEAGSSDEKEDYYRRLAPSETRPSLIHLLAHPDQYHGKNIQVEGYLVVEFEGTALYLSRDDAYNGITGNSIWVRFEDNAMRLSMKDLAKAYNGKFALLEGTFDKTEWGHGCCHPAGLRNVTRVLKLGRPRLIPTPKVEPLPPGQKDTFAE